MTSRGPSPGVTVFDFDPAAIVVQPDAFARETRPDDLMAYPDVEVERATGAGLELPRTPAPAALMPCTPLDAAVLVRRAEHAGFRLPTVIEFAAAAVRVHAGRGR